MEITKINTYPLEKCYCVAPLTWQGRQRLLVAAEKVNKCLLFDLDGNLLDTVWDGPGGTMSMVQVPGGDGCFLATHRFYSPNDSAEASIVHVQPCAEGGWRVNTVARLPFVHRFDILQKAGRQYLIACTIKSGHAYKNDWTKPGRVYVAELPQSLDQMDEEHPLELTVLCEHLTKNHGYCHCMGANGDYAIVGSEKGVMRIEPPACPDEEWDCALLIDQPTSDMALVDLDGDGMQEMITISPFHGDAVTIYHKNGTGYEPVYRCPQPMPFGHAIWAGKIGEVPVALIGHREGRRDLAAFLYRNGGYQIEISEEDAGSANIMYYKTQTEHRLLSANREHDEIAFYRIEV